MKFDIWIEGYAATGEQGCAYQLASDAEGDNFMDACEKWYNSQENAEECLGSFGKRYGRPTIWGCRLFDNEKDARKNYG